MTSNPEETIKKVVHRELEGEIVSTSGKKTVKVRVDTKKLHSKYRKLFTTSKKYAAHDEKGIAFIGDTVVIQECRPISKTKRFFVKQVVKKAE
ncbi:MAG: 30S ribosomal protein S17 [Candidatus Magasanikbacteria bacterium CG_4_10_14_0_2_um_filter_37_12]|uniref:Small ribosomal subunit protein uS17 n=1 Tax=Candidatus Magasanikbacteria bacterium CG_4_10_14_0_2_um_filter_37_12 TaxID=1974637 RepID=A0A2M7V8L7_9BACT|nr:MAG: 30S ribosomal protein S17 [Candidatus Magasanikbacteria bacterium CG_4_10_14_0_2_um_filter_37_12]